MSEFHFPWLELAILTPLVGGLFVFSLRNQETGRRVCVLVSFLSMLFSVGEWIDFATLGSFEAHDRGDIVAAVFHRNLLVVDELSSPLLPLVSLLYLMVALATLRTKVQRFSFGATLISESILLATLCCREPWLLIALLTAATIPPFIELRVRRQSTRIYAIHMGLFAVLLAGGQLLLSTTAPGTSAFTAATSLLAAAALLRSGVFPLHGWMSDLFDKATFGTALLFVTPMTGAYAIMRLVLPIADDWLLQGIAILSVLTALYAAGMASVQRDARRFFCFLFLSHSSLVLVGMELATPLGLTGALCVWLSVGLSLGGFGITLRCLEARTGRLSLDRYHGLQNRVPILAALFLITGLASIGFPGTIGFIGTELLIEGAVAFSPWVGAAVVVAAAINGIAMMHAYFRVFTGVPLAPNETFRARRPERIAVLVLIALILGGGFFPQPGVASRYHAAAELIRQRSQTVSLRSQLPATAVTSKSMPRSDHDVTHPQ